MADGCNAFNLLISPNYNSSPLPLHYYCSCAYRYVLGLVHPTHRHRHTLITTHNCPNLSSGEHAYIPSIPRPLRSPTTLSDCRCAHMLASPASPATSASPAGSASGKQLVLFTYTHAFLFFHCHFHPHTIIKSAPTQELKMCTIYGRASKELIFFIFVTIAATTTTTTIIYNRKNLQARKHCLFQTKSTPRVPAYRSTHIARRHHFFTVYAFSGTFTERPHRMNQRCSKNQIGARFLCRNHWQLWQIYLRAGLPPVSLNLDRTCPPPMISTHTPTTPPRSCDNRSQARP